VHRGIICTGYSKGSIDLSLRAVLRIVTLFGAKDRLGGQSMARGTIEFTFPIIPDKARGAFFYDVGFVDAKSYDFNPDKNAVGSDFGVGVRLNLPIGPLRIDYGWPIQNAGLKNTGGKFNFNVGYQF